MSKTDKTQPHDRKVLEHPVEFHDHRNGICELLANPDRTYEVGDSKTGACYVTGEYWRPEFRCGRSCKTCWGWWAKAEDRQARRQRKRECRDWEKEY